MIHVRKGGGWGGGAEVGGLNLSSMFVSSLPVQPWLLCVAFVCVGPVIGRSPFQGGPTSTTPPDSWDRLQQTPESQEWMQQVQKMDGWNHARM